MATHLESLIFEYLDWQGYVVRRNIKVGKRDRGGWEMELDVMGYHHKSRDLVHYEPSLDALDWDTRERRFRKKFEAGRRYIHKSVFPWLDPATPLRQIAVLVIHPRRRNTIAGGAYLTPAILDGRWMVRVSIGSLTTEREHIESLWELMQREAQGG